MQCLCGHLKKSNKSVGKYHSDGSCNLSLIYILNDKQYAIETTDFKVLKDDFKVSNLKGWTFTLEV